MISWSRAFRLYLLEPSSLRTWLGGPFVYKPAIPPGPNGPTMPRRAISFRGNGGSADSDLPIHRPTVNVRIWSTSEDDAEVGYRLFHDRMVRKNNIIVADTFSEPDERVAFYNWTEITPGQPLEDPGTGWPYIFTVWAPTVSTLTIPVA